LTSVGEKIQNGGEKVPGSQGTNAQRDMVSCTILNVSWRRATIASLSAILRGHSASVLWCVCKETADEDGVAVTFLWALARRGMQEESGEEAATNDSLS